MKRTAEGYFIRILLIVPVIMLLCNSSCKQAVERDENNSVIGQVRSSDGVKIDYRMNGPQSDTAIIFIHEWLCNQTYWQPQIRFFAQHYRIATLDLAGHGRSGDDREQWTMDLFADDVMAVIKKLKVKKVYLVGHSLGASVAVKVALKIPEKVIAIFAVDTFQNLTVDYPAANIDNFIAPYRKDFSTTIQKHASVVFGDDPDPGLVGRIMREWSEADPQVAIAIMIDYLHFKASDWTSMISVPVYAMNSIKFPANEQGNKRVLKQYTMIPLRRVGHFPQLEDPETFNNVLWSVLAANVHGKSIR